jgi:hypothetical protein
MDDNNPALWNIRHDITPMLVERRLDYPPHRFRAVIRVTSRGRVSFAACASADGPRARSPEPRPSQRLQSNYATAAINEKHYGLPNSVCSTVIFSLLSSFPLLW